MRKSMVAGAVLAAVLVMFQSSAPGHEDQAEKRSAGASGPKLETLLKAELEGVEGTEVIVSRVTIPPNTALPKHWHPGEEFGYVLEGSVVLWQEGKDDITGKPGDAIKIPLKQIHTAITKDEGATVLVFRVHEKGKPERVLVEETSAPGKSHE